MANHCKNGIISLPGSGKPLQLSQVMWDMSPKVAFQNVSSGTTASGLLSQSSPCHSNVKLCENCLAFFP